MTPAELTRRWARLSTRQRVIAINGRDYRGRPVPSLTAATHRALMREEVLDEHGAITDIGIAVVEHAMGSVRRIGEEPQP